MSPHVTYWVQGLEYLFGLLESALLAVSPLSFPHIPSLLASVAAQKVEKALVLCKSCSAIMKTPLITFVFITNPNHSSIPTTGKEINSTPAKALCMSLTVSWNLAVQSPAAAQGD